MEENLKLIERENIVWYIYFLIILLALYTNKLEKDNLYCHDSNKEKLAKKINSLILVVAFLIYLYFTSVSINSCKKNMDQKSKRVAFERLIVNFLFLIAGAIAIFADYDSNTDIDLGIF